MRTWRPADVNVLEVADDRGGQCSVSLAQEALRCEPQVCAGTEEAEFSQTLARDLSHLVGGDYRGYESLMGSPGAWTGDS